ncbi:MAG: hypothetical protein IJ422_07315 [Oscillospiraceae bacterium]|nr:hypothetical protein [Oscillospiraceae bacterium]
MKKFEQPEIEIIRFRIEDIITASGRDDELPLDPGNVASTFELPLVRMQ